MDCDDFYRIGIFLVLRGIKPYLFIDNTVNIVYKAVKSSERAALKSPCVIVKEHQVFLTAAFSGKRKQAAFAVNLRDKRMYVHSLGYTSV